MQIFNICQLLGSSGSILLVTSLGISADFIGQNTESGAFVYGFMSFTDKLGNGLAVMIIQYLLVYFYIDKINIVYIMCKIYKKFFILCCRRKFIVSTDYYRNILSYVCGCSAICGLLMILYIKPFPSYTGKFLILH